MHSARVCAACARAVLHVPPRRRKSARDVLRAALYTLGLTSSMAGTPASRSQPLLADSGAPLPHHSSPTDAVTHSSHCLRRLRKKRLQQHGECVSDGVYPVHPSRVAIRRCS